MHWLTPEERLAEDAEWEAYYGTKTSPFDERLSCDEFAELKRSEKRERQRARLVAAIRAFAPITCASASEIARVEELFTAGADVFPELKERA